MVANFRSYEGQLRLLTAVIAAHPDLKLNYKGEPRKPTVLTPCFLSITLPCRTCPFTLSTALFCHFKPVKKVYESSTLTRPEIAKHFGSDWTESGIEHFFRPIKKNGKAVKDLVRRGEDAKNFDHKPVS